MISALVDITLTTGWWVLQKSYNGIYYMFYGDPQLEKEKKNQLSLRRIEDQERAVGETLANLQEINQQLVQNIIELRETDRERQKQLELLRNDIFNANKTGKILLQQNEIETNK